MSGRWAASRGSRSTSCSFPTTRCRSRCSTRSSRRGARACAAAGVAVVGGHTVRDPELKFGLSVTGEVAPGELWSNRTAQAGQALVLTKALGTGVLGQAIKKGVASDEAMAAAIASMTHAQPGRRARRPRSTA